MNTLPMMEKLLDLSADQAGGGEVEWKRLGDISTLITKGTTPKEFCSDGVNYIKIENILDGKISLTKRTYVSENDHFGELKRSVLVENDILFAIAGSIGKCAIVDSESLPANTNQALAIIRLKESVNHRYVFYALQTGAMKDYISKFNKTSAQPNLNLKQMGDFIIPIPALNIQAEIVRILDAFTTYTAELTAELTARKKQYNHYRDQLLSFSETEVEWKTLGEITTGVASGRNKVRASNGPFTVYGSTGPIGFCEQAEYSGEMLLVARVGAYAGQVNFVSGEFDVSDNTLVVRPSSEWNVRFAYHQLTNMNLNKYAVGAGQPLVTGGLLKSLKVPVPPFDEQVRIASILDKFDALTASLSEGLPREIELRQKQYEYYRDRLLSFPKPARDLAA